MYIYIYIYAIVLNFKYYLLSLTYLDIHDFISGRKQICHIGSIITSKIITYLTFQIHVKLGISKIPRQIMITNE